MPHVSQQGVSEVDPNPHRYVVSTPRQQTHRLSFWASAGPEPLFLLDERTLSAAAYLSRQDWFPCGTRRLVTLRF
jgi:hypothetical protein